MPDNTIIPLRPPGADEHARAETERKRKLFAWADDVLRQLGLIERIARANDLGELRKIAFDLNAAEVDIDIREALHPVHGARADFFTGLRAGALRRLLQKRFDEAKAEREAELRRHGGSGSQQSAPDWTDQLILDDKGGVRPILNNEILILTNHPQWQGVLAFDEFSARVIIRKRPPWGEEKSDAPWTDHHESLTRVWFQREDIIKAGQGDIGRAVQAAARSNPFHPVRDYFDALVWDERPRLDAWLVTYFHAQDSAYTRAIGPRFMISAVARVYQPGCQVDHLPVLEGPQGKLKSTALRRLAVKDSWFTDRLSHVSGKDAAIETSGVWIIEIAEMDALTKGSAGANKAYVTRRHDRFRPPYGKHLISLPRQCVFVGTINPPAGGYLKDPTGARRFWPVACHGTIDLDALERDRDQLWAEAVARYQAGAKWWLETPELEALATAEQRLRFKSDPWRENVERWIGQRTDVSISEVLKGALNIQAREQTQTAANRVVGILTALGFTKYRARRARERANRYRRENR